MGALESDPSLEIAAEVRTRALSESLFAPAKTKSIQDPETCSDDPNFCNLDDDTDASAQYVDLLANPERFTGYAGASSSRVWKSIYEENCFTPVKFIDPSRSAAEGGSGFAPLGLMSSSNNEQVKGLMMRRKEEEKRVLESLVAPRDGGDDVCLEKRVFYKLISGLHASISIHICEDYLDRETGLWVCFSSLSTSLLPCPLGVNPSMTNTDIPNDCSHQISNASSLELLSTQNGFKTFTLPMSSFCEPSPHRVMKFSQLSIQPPLLPPPPFQVLESST